MSKFYLKIKTAYIKSLLSFYYPTAANTVQITIQIYSDIKLLFVQYKTYVTSQLMWMPPYLSVEDHIRNKIGWTWSQTCLTSWLLVTQSYVLVKDVLLRRSWVRFLSGTQIFSLSHARVMLNDSSFTFHYQAKIHHVHSLIICSCYCVTQICHILILALQLLTIEVG